MKNQPLGIQGHWVGLFVFRPVFIFFFSCLKKKMLSKSFQLHELCMLRGLETASCVSPPAVLFLC